MHERSPERQRLEIQVKRYLKGFQWTQEIKLLSECCSTNWQPQQLMIVSVTRLLQGHNLPKPLPHYFQALRDFCTAWLHGLETEAQRHTSSKLGDFPPSQCSGGRSHGLGDHWILGKEERES